MRRLVAVIVALAVAAASACGELVGATSDTPVPPNADGGDADVPVEPAPTERDAGPPPMRLCDAGVIFGDASVARIDLDGGSSEDTTPRLTRDELTMYFTRGTVNDDSSRRIFVATRADRGGPFAPPKEVVELESANDGFGTVGVGHPWVSSDGTFLYWTHENDVFLYDDFGALEVGGAFAQAGIVQLTGGGGYDVDPFPTDDTREQLYFARGAGNGNYDLVVATRGDGGVFDAPTSLGSNISTASPELLPTLSADGLELFFTRYDAQNRGHMYMAVRASARATFDTVQIAGGFDSPDAIDWPGWLSADGCRLYFSSQRNGDAEQHVYVARR